MFKISLKAARVNANIAKKDAAKQLGISVDTLNNWENGRTCPSVEKFRELCNLYECPGDVIFLRREFA